MEKIATQTTHNEIEKLRLNFSKGSTVTVRLLLLKLKYLLFLIIRMCVLGIAQHPL